MSEPERLVERSGWGLTRQLLTDACAERAPETVRRNVHSAVDSTLATLGVGVATLVSLKAGAMSSGVSSAAASGAAVSSAAVSGAAVSSVAVSVASSGGVLSAVVSGVVAKAGLAMVLAGAGYYGATVVGGGERTSTPVGSESSSVAESTRLTTPERRHAPGARAAGVTVMAAPRAELPEAAAPDEEPPVASVDSLPLAEEPAPERGRPGRLGVTRPVSRTFSSTLGAELALIRKVRGLVSKGDVAGANAALNTYEEQFPDGSLQPEARQLRAWQVRSQLQGAKTGQAPSKK